uniref:Uncharacterized protein n=1 Tax=Gossypium raimondii TaxID=29730 RepID=A0A0D2QSF8_GOSRA|nr:hypothetical protein B456_004G055600 [Gossypium raimondii]
MANRFIIRWITVCIVLVSASIKPIEADSDRFNACFESCNEKCKNNDHGNAFCEVKCDVDCGADEVTAKFNIAI